MPTQPGKSNERLHRAADIRTVVTLNGRDAWAKHVADRLTSNGVVLHPSSEAREL